MSKIVKGSNENRNIKSSYDKVNQDSECFDL